MDSIQHVGKPLFLQTSIQLLWVVVDHPPMFAFFHYMLLSFLLWLFVEDHAFVLLVIRHVDLSWCIHDVCCNNTISWTIWNSKCNMTNIDKLKLLNIFKSLYPRCFGRWLRTYYVRWFANQMTWMTSNVFESWMMSLNVQFRYQRSKFFFINKLICYFIT